MAKPRPSSRTSRIQSSPIAPARRVATRTDARLGVLADVAHRLLGDPQDDRLLGLVEPVGGRVEVDGDAHAAAVGELLGGVADGAVEAELLEERRPQLVDEAAHLAQLALQDGAQLAQLDQRLGRRRAR